MTTISILNSIIEAADANLEAVLVSEVAQGDLSRAGLVRVGQLQDDPTTAGINVLTSMNDRSDYDKWIHAVVGGHQDSSVKIDIPPYEVGGGEMWWRRFCTDLIQFWPENFTRIQAQQYANVLLSRCEYGIRTTPFGDIQVDSFGEVAVQVFVVSSRNIESGGPDQFIYRGKILWEVLTQRM